MHRMIVVELKTRFISLVVVELGEISGVCSYKMNDYTLRCRYAHGGHNC